ENAIYEQNCRERAVIRRHQRPDLPLDRCDLPSLNGPEPPRQKQHHGHLHKLGNDVRPPRPHLPEFPQVEQSAAGQNRHSFPEQEHAPGVYQSVLMSGCEDAFRLGEKCERPRLDYLAAAECLEIARQRTGGGISIVWPFREGLEANRFQVARDVALELAGRNWMVLDDSARQRVRGPFEWQMTCQELVENYAEAVHVAAGVGIVAATGRLLRRHVWQGTKDSSLGSPRAACIL